MWVFFSLLKIVASKIIVKGLTSSMGWNLGKNIKSSHRFAPLTSVPTIGTKNKKNKDTKNKKTENLKRFFLLKDEKKIKIIIPIKTYIRCLKKKK